MNKHYAFFEIEEKWKKVWNNNNTYKFEQTDKPIFSIDTPPPTVIGKMHLGHSFGYTLLDFVARFKRMNGFQVFFPFGFDDNGLPTQALIEKITGKKAEDMNRLEFIELCLKETKEIENKLKQQWVALGISAEWNFYYSTIDKESRRISQYSFLDLFNKGRVYQKDAPFFWCPHCKKAVSQRETKHVDEKVTFYNIRFKVKGMDDLIVSVSRVEFLPGCVALFVNPDDERYKKYVGLKAKVPIFESEVPILTDRRISPNRGTGVKMCATFADNLDTVLFLAHSLPLKKVIDNQGKLTSLAKEFEGFFLEDARKAIVDRLKKLNLIESETEGIILERIHKECNTKIIYQSKKQWFVKILDLKEKLIELGNKIQWNPEFMKKRFESWIKNIEWDWNISRQRKFGVPFPVWYCKDCGNIILAKEEDLPVDPEVDESTVNKCPRCGSTNIIPETDVMDTWATSSLNPFIITKWLSDRGFFEKMFPLTLRVQSHDIIYTWLTYTLLKSHLHENQTPWKEVMIHGFVNDEEGKKISLSRGNFKGVLELINSYGADAIRFWAASKNLGEDLALNESELKRAKRVINKLWNVSRLVRELLKDHKIEDSKYELRTLEKWLFYRLDEVITKVTKSFESYKFADGRKELEVFLIKDFSNTYLKIVSKQMNKLSDKELAAVRFASYHVLLALIKMFSPIMPFITEEIYHTIYVNEINKSIHLNKWPSEFKLGTTTDYDCGEMLKDLIKAARRDIQKKSIKLKENKENLIIKVHIKEKRYSILFDKIREYLKEFFGISKLEFSDSEIKNKSDIYKIGIEVYLKNSESNF